jgi:hypothetical protein
MGNTVPLDGYDGTYLCGTTKTVDHGKEFVVGVWHSNGAINCGISWGGGEYLLIFWEDTQQSDREILHL